MKAVLVIDMPTECNDEKCPICYDYAMCSYLNRWIEDGKPNDCPLRPLPNRKEDLHYPCNEYLQAVNEGWNACLDEIAGETE